MIIFRCKNYKPYAHGYCDGRIQGTKDFVKWLNKKLVGIKISPKERAALYKEIDQYIKNYGKTMLTKLNNGDTVKTERGI